MIVVIGPRRRGPEPADVPPALVRPEALLARFGVAESQAFVAAVAALAVGAPTIEIYEAERVSGVDVASAGGR